MSDYLHNLVARHLNKIEVVQPRLASRFEPKSAMPSPLGARRNPLAPEDLESHLEVEPGVAESPIVSHRSDELASLSRPAAPEHRVVLEASTENILSPEPQPPEIPAPVSNVDPTSKADAARSDDSNHAQAVEADPAPNINEPISPVPTQSTVLPSTPEEEAQARPLSARPVRVEAARPEKKSDTPPEPPSLQQTQERSDTYATDKDKAETELSPAHLRQEIEITVERREAVEQPDAPMSNPTIAAQPAHHPERRHPAALAKSEVTEATIKESAPSRPDVESTAQDISSVVSEKVYERKVERVLVERLLPADARPNAALPENDSEAVKPAARPHISTGVVAQPGVEPLVGPEAEARPQVSTGVVAQPQVIRHGGPKATPSAEVRQGAEPAPTINVTIGRIEVRAVTSDASASERRQGASVQRMSLSDYLRRRAAGGVK